VLVLSCAHSGRQKTRGYFKKVQKDSAIKEPRSDNQLKSIKNCRRKLGGKKKDIREVKEESALQPHIGTGENSGGA